MKVPKSALGRENNGWMDTLQMRAGLLEADSNGYRRTTPTLKCSFRGMNWKKLLLPRVEIRITKHGYSIYLAGKESELQFSKTRDHGRSPYTSTHRYQYEGTKRLEVRVALRHHILPSRGDTWMGLGSPGLVSKLAPALIMSGCSLCSISQSSRARGPEPPPTGEKN